MGATMFAGLFLRVLGGTPDIHRRPEGVAFFKATKNVYNYSSMSYLALNLPIPGQRGQLMHCAYSDGGVLHCLSDRAVTADVVEPDVWRGSPVDWDPQTDMPMLPDRPPERHAGTLVRGLAFGLRSRAGEQALFGISCNMNAHDWARHKLSGGRDVKILADYFHSHILRINGYDATSDMLMSARELDCLKWTAAGKDSLEASIILGISERTVRFHLNAAREKLNCTTTAQAIAKAVGYQLIDV